MQQIKQSTIDQVLTMCITQGGPGDEKIKGKGKRCKVHGVWCMTWVNCSVCSMLRVCMFWGVT